MATWDDVRRLATALPEVDERVSGQGTSQWRVRDKLFVWERPLRRADLEALGPEAPQGPILGARVPDLGAKDAWLAAEPSWCFTTPHFHGYPAVLAQLDLLPADLLEELVTEAWRCRAPRRLAEGLG